MFLIRTFLSCIFNSLLRVVSFSAQANCNLLIMNSLEQKIAQGEHLQQDFKYQITNSRKIARTLSAFANTQGGRLLIGVKDNGTIAGIRSNEEIYMVEGAADLYTNPVVSVEFFTHEVDGKNVVEALVQPSANKPHFVREENGKQVAYFRKDDENFVASPTVVKFWKYPQKTAEKITYSEKEQRLLDFLKLHPFITVKRCASITKQPIKKAEDMLATLLHWGVIDWDFNGKFSVYFLAETNKV